MVTIATTRSLIPLFIKAVFIAFWAANSKKLLVVEVLDLIRISRFDVSLALGSRLDLAGLGLFPTTVYSCG